MKGGRGVSRTGTNRAGIKGSVRRGSARKRITYRVKVQKIERPTPVITYTSNGKNKNVFKV